MTVRSISLALILILSTAACSGAVQQTATPTDPPAASAAPTTPSTPPIDPTGTSQPTQAAEPTDQAQPVAPAEPTPDTEPTPAAAFNQPWATAELTDVTTGERFRIADLAADGRVVFIETMAIWCSNCRAQQREAVAAFAQLDPERVTWLGVDVESSETADALNRYRDQNGFPFRYAVADANLARALVDEFGDIVLSPPSVNLIVLGADGTVTHMNGHHSAAQLVEIALLNGA